jgi:hypothetical protein
LLTSTIRHLAALSGVLILLAPTAHARDGWNLSIGADFQHFDYREYSDQGTLLDRENGFLPGLQLGISHLQGAWLVAAQLSYHAGSVTYTGQTNGGAPISTTTGQRMVDVELLTGYQFRQGSQLQPTLYLGAANHSWRRDIQPTHTASGAPVRGLLETYRWWQGFLGTRMSLYEAPAFTWGLDARLMRIIAPEIDVDYYGLYDNSHLRLGERWGFRLTAPVSVAIHQSTTIVVEPYLERYSLGRSSSAPLTSQGMVRGSVSEPDSTTSNYGVSLNLRKDF